jgi:branched-subunit amino acid aminotransferase/4-amino-4-deoxychorismate lyase
LKEQQMNRAFIYGDLLFETIRVMDGVAQLMGLHYNRLKQSAAVLKYETNLTMNQFEQAVQQCVAESGLQKARVRFVLHRNATGFYTPDAHQTHYFAEAFSWEVPAAQKPLTAGVYTDNFKPCTELSSLKSGNGLLYVMAGIYARERGWDDAIILNEHGCICEATASNIFMVKQEKVYTPALTEGCVAGVMRAHTLSQLRHADYEVEETVISMEQLLDADAVFLTNALRGISHVGSIGDKQFQSFVLPS